MGNHPASRAPEQPRSLFAIASPSTARTARLVLAVFLFTFLAARVVVFLIMSRRVPDLYFHFGGTHVHHLNYGIFLLSGVGAFLLFGQPAGRRFSAAAALYAVGLALTFDEFGMWLHLGGAYWQRASFDAIVVIAAVLALIAFAPSLKHLRPRHWVTAVVLVVCVIVFAILLVDSARYAGKRIAPAFQQIEAGSPP